MVEPWADAKVVTTAVQMVGLTVDKMADLRVERLVAQTVLLSVDLMAGLSAVHWAGHLAELSAVK